MEDEALVEEKEELMISPTGGKPFKKTAYFLKSNVPHVVEEDEEMEEEDGNLKLKLTFISPKCKWPLQVNFYSWGCPTRRWEKWVENMHAKFQTIWKKSGSEEAILGSVYKIYKNEELLFNIAERWCSETNTFLFPWGEATVILEDMMILGGFSVLGCSPFSLPLNEVHMLITIRKLRKANSLYGMWLDCFMGSGSHVEHEAFLAMWLSKFVFPGNDTDKINEDVFPIAVHLARGTRIALAPALLAAIYKDLTLLKGTMAEASKYFNGEMVDSLEMGLWASMQLVQIWVWERLVPLRPEKANFIDEGDPRVIRWHAIEQEDTINMRPAIDSAGEAFLWRPYALAVDKWVMPWYYKGGGEWLPINGKMNDDNGDDHYVELKSFAKCLMVCELQGMDCKEIYQPHRVAMQFGYDQDLPEWIDSLNELLEFCWYRPFDNDAFLFVPSRLVEADVSYRYMKWWRNRVLVPSHRIPGMKQRARKARRPASRNSKASAQLVNCTNGYFRKGIVMHPVKTEPGIDSYDLPPPCFPSMEHMGKAYGPPGFHKKNLSKIVGASPSGFPNKNLAEINDGPPPGFPKKNLAEIDDAPPPGFPKKNLAEIDDAPPPGFPKKNLPEIYVTSPPGFPKKDFATVGVAPPPGFPKKFFAATDLAPTGFLRKGNVAEPTYSPFFCSNQNAEKLDVLPPPGFPAIQNMVGISPPGFPLQRKSDVEEHNIHKVTYLHGSGRAKVENQFP